MKSQCLITVLSMFSLCVNIASSYPLKQLKPLNERPSNLIWQAYLLVDQSKDVDVLRRRITPKSVFIAPTFNRTSLDCPDGWNMDSKGHCTIKVIQIKEPNIEEFILSKLVEEFGEYDDEPIEHKTPGTPLQINIPLVADEGEVEERPPNVAIVITGNVPKTAVKTEVKRNENDSKFNVESVAAMLGVKPEDVEMTTIAELTTTETEMPTTTFFTTTTVMETTTSEPITETTTDSESTTTIINNRERLSDDIPSFEWRTLFKL